MELNIHENIIQKLDFFISNQKIPNIIFHGPSGSGKRFIVNQFIDKIYENNNEFMKNYVMYVDCAHGKGIKFIREELKYFAKTHINFNNGNFFKSIILLNADKLTIDAQSALRRCIEQFSHTTRFFIIVEDKYKLLRPILSRFCEIYIPEPTINNKSINLHCYNLEKTYNLTSTKDKRLLWLKKFFNKNTIDFSNIINVTDELYEKSYSCLDIMDYINNHIPSNERKDKLLVVLQKIKKEFRNEKLLILFTLNFLFLRCDDSLENISFM